MSTFSNKPIQKLTVAISNNFQHLVTVSVFDASNRKLTPTNDFPYLVVYELPHGLYVLRLELNGCVKDEVVLLDTDKKFDVVETTFNYTNSNIPITPPQQFSSALLTKDGYQSSFEYYTDPAVDLSKKDTFTLNPPPATAATSSLFIFLRFPTYEWYTKNKQAVTESFNKHFELLDEQGNTVLNFADTAGIKIDTHHGWLAFNAALPAGTYYLKYNGEEPRLVPVNLFEYWHTQFFMTLSHKPLFGSIRIFISRQRRFNPDEQTNKYIDVFLDKLQNQQYSLDQQMIEMAAYGKFESPMLGLICSYIYLKSKQTTDDNLFKTIVKNMEHAILRNNEDSPDLLALNLLAAEHIPNYQFTKRTVSGTPMLRVGFEAIMQAASKDASLITANSINDFIAGNLYSDSPFVTFKPVPFASLKSSKSDDSEFEAFVPGGETSDYAVPLQSILEKNTLKTIQSYGESDVQDSWIKLAIVDALKAGNDATINSLAEELVVPASTVDRSLKELKKQVTGI